MVSVRRLLLGTLALLVVGALFHTWSGRSSAPAGESVVGKHEQQSRELKAFLQTKTPHPFPRKFEEIQTTQVTTLSEFPFKIETMASNDILSRYIQTHSVWDRAKSATFEKMSKNTGKFNYLDVGANLGWFSLLAASVGHTVVAFEPFADNIALFERSVEDNPGFEQLITIVPFGLAERDTSCVCISEKQNQGDCHNVCDGDSDNALSKLGNNDPKYKYEVRGKMNGVALDKFAPQLKGFFDYVKIDVEGYELPAVLGADATLFTGPTQVPFIESEFAPSMMANLGYDAQAYLRFYHERGYSIQHDGTVIEDSDVARAAFVEAHRTHILDIDISIPSRVVGWFENAGSKYHLEAS